jgi:hypothetical protein
MEKVKKEKKNLVNVCAMHYRQNPIKPNDPTVRHYCESRRWEFREVPKGEQLLFPSEKYLAK